MDELKIGIEEFKALSSDTRINIIKLLHERNHTLSELSAKLNMSSPTIKQHIGTLLKSDLIQQKDEGRKWKYYCLTRKGKKLVEPENEPKVMILLTASIVGMLFLVYVIFGTGISFSFTGTEVDSSAALKQFIAPTTEIKNDLIDSETGTAGSYKTSEEDKLGATETTDETKTGQKETGIKEQAYLIALLVAFALAAGFFAAKAGEKRTKIFDD